MKRKAKPGFVLEVDHSNLLLSGNDGGGGGGEGFNTDCIWIPRTEL